MTMAGHEKNLKPENREDVISAAMDNGGTADDACLGLLDLPRSLRRSFGKD